MFKNYLKNQQVRCYRIPGTPVISDLPSYNYCEHTTIVNPLT